jgi:hypothetical protein
MALEPIPLASESYQLASVPAAQHRLLNLYPETLPDNARAKYYLKSTPGLVQLSSAGTGPISATATTQGNLFVMSGEFLYRYEEATTGLLVGPIQMGPVGLTPKDYNDLSHNTIAIGLAGAAFVSPPRAYFAALGSNTLNVITAGSGNFPVEGVSSVCYLDGYYIFTVFDGSYFFVSNLLAPGSFSGLSYTKMSSQLDFLQHGIPHNGELWMFGWNTVSAWYNTGDPIAPFAPRTGGVIQMGCASYKTVQEIDGSLWWLGTDGVVYRTNGYQAKRVSTHAIEELLASYGGGDLTVNRLLTTRALAMTQEGHDFYVLHLPLVGRTFAYDCTTGMWSERSSTDVGTGRWLLNTASKLPGQWVLGDATDGKLWVMDRTVPTEKGVAVRRLAQLPALVTHGPRAFMSRLEVEMQTGIGGLSSPALLSWSDDGGYTYSNPRALDTGASGAVRTRVATTRLGSFRQRTLRLSSSGQLTVYGVDVDMGAGDS